jgi:hypothetical protein
LPKYEPKGRFLEDYPELVPYLQDTDEGVDSKDYRIRFASTKKSSLFTHWSNRSFPVDEKDLFVPNGLHFGYYDDRLGVWPSQEPFKPSFSHHFELVVPQQSPLSSVIASLDMSINTNGLSSYQVIARQTKCPSGLNIHEFTGNLSLFSGKTRRWLQILAELGSFNLNFSSEATSQLISSLALQLGPATTEEDHLGAVHRHFLDPYFCRGLLDQLNWRMEAISSNWRESNCMEMLITLLLRLEQLGTGIRYDVHNLILRAREITLGWTIALRQELQFATDIETAERCSKYALWAALLCRRTFAVQLDSTQMLDSKAMETFLECSVALQDSLVSDPAKLNGILKNSVIRDTKMVARMHLLLRQSLEMSPASLVACLKTVWPNINEDPNRAVSPPKFLKENPHWIELEVQSLIYSVQQTVRVHVHLLEGHFLVMGRPLGRLPAMFRESAMVRQLFGTRKLLTYPSYLAGMTYVLASNVYGHEIHLG